MAYRTLIATVISLSALLFSCSLNPLRSVRSIRIALPEKLRDEPLLSQMTHFAIAVSGGGTNSLSSGQVGNRSLECLNLTGQVFFPFTLAELTSGVPIALNQGNYRFSIVAFANGVGTPATVAQLYSEAPALKSYLVAQAQVDTSGSPNVTLTSTYNSASAPDLQVTCPSGSVSYHGLFVVSDFLSVYQYDGSGWGFSSIEASVVNPNLFVDAEGAVHVSYRSYDAVSEGFRYLTNSSGTYQSERIFAGAGNDPTAITQATTGELYAVSVAATLGPDVRMWRRVSAGNWSNEGAVMPVGSGNYPKLILKTGPSNEVLLAADYNGTLRSVYVATGTGSALGTVTEISSAGGFPCATSSDLVDGVVDAAGHSHIVFRCATGPTVFRVGYANNTMGGTWITFDLAAVNTAEMYALSFGIDGDGNLHAAFGDGNEVRYLTGSSVTGIWGATTTAYEGQPMDVIKGVALAAKGANDVQMMVHYDNSGGNRLIPINNRTGSWLAESLMYDNQIGLLLTPTLSGR